VRILIKTYLGGGGGPTSFFWGGKNIGRRWVVGKKKKGARPSHEKSARKKARGGRWGKSPRKNKPMFRRKSSLGGGCPWLEKKNHCHNPPKRKISAQKERGGDSMKNAKRREVSGANLRNNFRKKGGERGWGRKRCSDLNLQCEGGLGLWR